MKYAIALAISALLGTSVQAVTNYWYSSTYSYLALDQYFSLWYGYSATVPYGTIYTAGTGPYYQTSSDATFYDGLDKYQHYEEYKVSVSMPTYGFLTINLGDFSNT